MKMIELDPGRFFQIIDEKGKVVAAVAPKPYEAVWVATQPRTQRVLASGKRDELLPQVLQLRATGQL